MLNSRQRQAVKRHNDRAIEKGLIGNLTLMEWEQTIDFFCECCAYCGRYVGKDKLVLEHWTPISSQGGTTKLNCLPSCSSCNQAKGSFNGTEFFDYLESAWQSPVAIYTHRKIQEFMINNLVDKDKQ